MHKGRNGMVLWDDAIRVGIEVRKKLRTLRKQFIAEATFNRFPGFEFEVQGVYADDIDGRVVFHTYVVQEPQ